MMPEGVFESLVAEALDSLPEEFLVHMENIDVVIETWPTKDDLEAAGVEGDEDYGLLGLYTGVPLTERGGDYAGYLPDRIVLFQGPIEEAAGHDPEAIREEVRFTVVHEIAHHYGISDERLEEMGWG
ncbi:MAG: metallopeptidase family protein [Thermoleophilia bacterium]|nr:metallopeptidase family protein [Thermoleophilia bacterium]